MRGGIAEWLKMPRLFARLVVNVDPSRTNLQDFQRAALHPSCRLVRSMTPYDAAVGFEIGSEMELLQGIPYFRPKPRLAKLQMQFWDSQGCAACFSDCYFFR
jgi:hypothetical protein